MKVALDFLVLILFFGTYYVTKDIYAATAVAIVGGVIQAIYSWIKDKKLEPMQLINLFIILFFGGATILLQDDTWIKWKPTVLYWIFSVILLGGLTFKKLFLRSLLGKEMVLPEKIWLNLTLAWSVFFILLGGLNLWVAFHYDLESWVTFKTFGAMGLLVVFFIGQGVYLYKYLPEEKKK